MTKKFDIGSLHLLCSDAGGKEKIAYILYPMDILDAWIDNASAHLCTSIAVVTGMDWQNVFSPWPAKGVPAGTPDFKGQSPQFLKALQESVVPEVEKRLGISPNVERTLVGVSMSGLFALWQWALCDTFHNIASLSGSFWYEGFVDWLERKNLPKKNGVAYFLLGNQESKSRVKEFQSVAADTAIVVDTLKKAGIRTQFESVPGDHYSNPVPRLNDAFSAIYLSGKSI